MVTKIPRNPTTLVDDEGRPVYSRTPLGYVQITDVSTAIGLTTPPATARIAVIRASAAVRWRDDGVDPTSSVGMPLGANEALEYDGPMSAIKFIDNGGTAALDVSYYG